MASVRDTVEAMLDAMKAQYIAPPYVIRIPSNVKLDAETLWFLKLQECRIEVYQNGHLKEIIAAQDIKPIH